ncbi:MAG: hypothetical protein DRP08_03330 [Candidatus Aenigmatarchaeota archaeon]|nr:MAG: hypothetical protein DRP08_03330 [Candidatus Aenigmarchaeota archaeon]
MNIDSVKEVVQSNGYRKVLVLLPAGLMADAGELAKVIPEPIFLSDPCYGACDVPLHLLDRLGADAVFNFGHSRPIGLKYPENVHFFEVQLQDVPEFVPDFHRVGLVFVIQYRDVVGEYMKKLERAGKEVVMGGRPDFMATYPAQVTGCDVGAARRILDKVDGFVVACDGIFHAGAVAALGKPTFNWFGERADPPRFPVAALFTAEKVGVLVGLKPGQNYEKEAVLVKDKLESLGKKVIMIVGDVITPEVRNFRVDFWVNASCPRISEEKYLSPSAPVKEVLKYL